MVDRVRAAIVADHRVAGRLALWGRRLMGEALSQAQRVAAERDSLAALLAGDWFVADASDPRHRREGSGMTTAFLQWHLERGVRSLSMVER